MARDRRRVETTSSGTFVDDVGPSPRHPEAVMASACRGSGQEDGAHRQRSKPDEGDRRIRMYATKRLFAKVGGWSGYHDLRHTRPRACDCDAAISEKLL